MSLEAWHYVTGGILVLLCALQIAGLAAGATLSRRAQALTLVSMLLLALEVMIR